MPTHEQPAQGAVVQLALAGGPVAAWRVACLGERTVFLVPAADTTDYTATGLDCGEAPRLLWMDIDAFWSDLRGAV